MTDSFRGHKVKGWHLNIAQCNVIIFFSVSKLINFAYQKLGKVKIVFLLLSIETRYILQEYWKKYKNEPVWNNLNYIKLPLWHNVKNTFIIIAGVLAEICRKSWDNNCSFKRYRIIIFSQKMWQQRKMKHNKYIFNFPHSVSLVKCITQVLY